MYYTIEVTETLKKKIIVSAEDEQSGVTSLMEEYYKDRITLEKDEHFDSVAFKIVSQL